MDFAWPTVFLAGIAAAFSFARSWLGAQRELKKSEASAITELQERVMILASKYDFLEAKISPELSEVVKAFEERGGARRAGWR